jgi:hypothetical protein
MPAVVLVVVDLALLRSPTAGSIGNSISAPISYGLVLLIVS